MSVSDAQGGYITSPIKIEPDWIDFNGHLNMAYYSILLVRALDESYPTFGLGSPYFARTQAAGYALSTMIAEVQLKYLRELHLGDSVVTRVRILDVDAKRMLVYQELMHAEQRWISATQEVMTLHLDMTVRKVAPWPDDVLKKLMQLKAAHSSLPVPPNLGRGINMPARKQ